jgi:hypothetical protein
MVAVHPRIQPKKPSGGLAMNSDSEFGTNRH